ncbi:uroporphyrinogen-III C-methyltransferase [Shewanella youngdeokensis]|uniref:uroporphyrinogen-III C-methyltransferase n=1 Tax=Shewanella youngdeokensis TaxID=2999068 RepID=A0ABZ0K2J7_9GAMM|nr:uroporphyrinogen-III C-methyltransferase [Shewanella sp. DAU334]
MNTVSKVAPGKVFLVGAGPGSPELLTWRALKLIEHCDVVCYDLLVSPAILSLIPSDKTLLPVGYRGYCSGSIEYGMHPDVVEQALLGKQVLRLKSGDPFIFGRGTEECRSLTHYGVEYEIVPGITSALGAAASAGFPLTSNGIASDVTFASGHLLSSTISNWASMGSSSGTLVLYMAAKKLAHHAAHLIERGRSADTPVALISSATRHNQQMRVTTLGSIDQVMDDAMHHDGSPVLVIMGQVVSLADELNWRNCLPLTGQVIMLDRSQEEAGDSLRMAGAEVVFAPEVQYEYGIDPAEWPAVLAARSLWLSDIHSAKGLFASAKIAGLDTRLWSWQLSGPQVVVQYFAELGMFITLAATPQPGEMELTAADDAVSHVRPHSVNAQSCISAYRQQMMLPNYLLGKINTYWVEERAAVALMHFNQQALKSDYYLTSQADIAEVLQQLGKPVQLLTSTDEGELIMQLSSTSTIRDLHVA